MFKKFNWGHGVVLALGCFIAFILFMIFVFPNGQQNSEMITDDYYADELAYQNVINAKNNADKLTQKPVYFQDMHGIKITFPQAIIDPGLEVKFNLYRTDDQRLDIKKSVHLLGDRSFTVPAAVLANGNYTLKVYWKKDKKDYQIDYDVVWISR